VSGPREDEIQAGTLQADSPADGFRRTWRPVRTQAPVVLHESYQRPRGLPMENTAKSTQFAPSGESKYAVFVTGAD
jgi:hypothetical protein